jgi:hypothetical protein
VASLLHLTAVFQMKPRTKPRTMTRRFETARNARHYRGHDALASAPQEEAMRMLMIAATVTLLTAGPLFAQEHGGRRASGYVTGLGGFAGSRRT